MRIAALGRIGLGSVSLEETHLANEILESASLQIRELTRTLDDARRGGMPSRTLALLDNARTQQLTRLQALTERLGFLTSEAFSSWRQEASTLVADAKRSVLEAEAALGSRGAQLGVRANISVATVLTVGVLGVGLFWLWSASKAKR